MPSTEDLELLRLFLADPAGGDQVFDDPKLTRLMTDNEEDVYAAAADGWRIKAANVSTWYMASLDGAMLSRQQVFDHCMKMADHYEKLGGGQITSVRMETIELDNDDSEFS